AGKFRGTAGRVAQLIGRRDAGALKPAAIGKVGGWQQPDGLLPIGAERLLRKIIDVNRNAAGDVAVVLDVAVVVVVDAGENGRGQSEDRVLDAEPWGQRPGLQRRIDKGKEERVGAIQEVGLGLLVTISSVDDQLRPVPQRPGKAGGEVGILLVAEIEWRVGAGPVGDEFVEADRWIDRSRTRKSQMLMVAGQIEVGGEFGCGVAEIAVAALLVKGVVGTISVGPDPHAVKGRRPWS